MAHRNLGQSPNRGRSPFGRARAERQGIASPHIRRRSRSGKHQKPRWNKATSSLTRSSSGKELLVSFRKRFHSLYHFFPRELDATRSLNLWCIAFLHNVIIPDNLIQQPRLYSCARSPRSGRQHKAWGASPRKTSTDRVQARESGRQRCRPLARA